jgi:hypothetical protein
MHVYAPQDFFSRSPRLFSFLNSEAKGTMTGMLWSFGRRALLAGVPVVLAVISLSAIGQTPGRSDGRCLGNNHEGSIPFTRSSDDQGVDCSKKCMPQSFVSQGINRRLGEPDSPSKIATCS